MNTVLYRRKANREWTWESPDCRTKNMIDFIVVNTRWKSAVTKRRTFVSPNIASDHRLVLARIRMKLGITRRKLVNRRFVVE